MGGWGVEAEGDAEREREREREREGGVGWTQRGGDRKKRTKIYISSPARSLPSCSSTVTYVPVAQHSTLFVLSTPDPGRNLTSATAVARDNKLQLESKTASHTR